MKYTKINLMLPTFGRVTNKKLPRFIASCVALVSNPKNIYLTFLVNLGDVETKKYLLNLRLPCQFEVLYWGQEKPHLGRMYNQIYEQTKFKEPGTLVSMVGDDMEWKTSGYDIAILDAINKCDGLGLIYCNDAYVQGKKLCVNIFTTRKYVELTKHPFMCELFKAYFLDTVWMKVAIKTKTAYYLQDVVLKHHHCSANPKHKDLTAVRLGKERIAFKVAYRMCDEYAGKIIKNLKGVL